MENLLTRKLERFAPLSKDERRLLDDVVKPTRNKLLDESALRGGVSFWLSALVVAFQKPWQHVPEQYEHKKDSYSCGDVSCEQHILLSIHNDSLSNGLFYSAFFGAFGSSCVSSIHKPTVNARHYLGATTCPY